jgi:hypothetical protein
MTARRDETRHDDTRHDEVVLAGPSRDLAIFAERAARHDPATPVRLVSVGDVLAAFVTTPFDCLGLRVTRLASRVDGDIDAVVEAVGLAAQARAARDDVLRLPPRLADITWVQPLPPRSGWSQLGRLAAGDVAARVASDTEEFRLRAATVPAGRGASVAREGIAGELWRAPLLGDAPARLAHAADYLGFLPDRGDVVVRAAGPWRRVDSNLGVTVGRLSDPLGLFVS